MIRWRSKQVAIALIVVLYSFLVAAVSPFTCWSNSLGRLEVFRF
jgi:hypothetical protein